MQGDTIIVEAHHRAAAAEIAPLILPVLDKITGKLTISIAGQSGSGKSESAQALADELAKSGITSVILQQDDYFVYPPRTNDKARREDISWVGPQEVNLALMERHLRAFAKNRSSTVKPLVIYEEDAIKSESIDLAGARVMIAEGTYTTLLDNADIKIFIDRDFKQTRAHREKRMRDKAELDPFIDNVLEIEHHIISSHKARANIVINTDYSVSAVGL